MFWLHCGLIYELHIHFFLFDIPIRYYQMIKYVAIANTVEITK